MVLKTSRAIAYLQYILYICRINAKFMQSIIESFCSYRGTSVDDVFSEKILKQLYCTRYMIWHYLHCRKKVPCSKLAKMFSRNIPSIFRGIRILKHDMCYHKRVREEYESIVKKIEDATEVTPSARISEEKN